MSQTTGSKSPAAVDEPNFQIAVNFVYREVSWTKYYGFDLLVTPNTDALGDKSYKTATRWTSITLNLNNLIGFIESIASAAITSCHLHCPCKPQDGMPATRAYRLLPRSRSIIDSQLQLSRGDVNPPSAGFSSTRCIGRLQLQVIINRDDFIKKQPWSLMLPRRQPTYYMFDCDPNNFITINCVASETEGLAEFRSESRNMIIQYYEKRKENGNVDGAESTGGLETMI
jgi:hypothetical protein